MRDRVVSRLAHYWHRLWGKPKPAFTARATEQDLWYCYRLLLNREPDAEGWAHFRSMIEHDGIPMQFLVNVFLDSQEFRDVRATLREVTLVELPRYRIYVRPSDYFIGGAIARERKYEQGVTRQIEKMLAPGAVFVDAGANIGYFTLLGAALVGPEGRVFAFEPNPDNCTLLQRSLAHNQFHQVQLFQNALAEAAQTFRFSCSAVDSNGRLLHESETSEKLTTIEVKAVTLDEVLPPLSRLDLIKMDIEGAEPRAWQGMRKSVERYRPALILEFSPTAIWKTSQTSPEAFLEALQEQYRLHILPPTGEVSKQALSTRELMAYAQSQPHHVDLVGFPR